MVTQTNIDNKIHFLDYNSPDHEGDFRLLELSVHSRNNDDVVELNSTSVFQEMEIFEDLFSNVLKGTLTITDSQGLAELLPFVGDETLVITLHTPGGQGTSIPRVTSSRTVVEEAIQQRFQIYDCVEVGTQERTKLYKLFFISEEYILNMKKRISKAYKGKTYSDIIKDIVDNFYGQHNNSFRKEVFTEQTLSEQNIIIPNWTPFEAVNFCASRSLSADIEPQDHTNTNQPLPPRPVGSLFFFYEKFGSGFYFESLESLIIKQKMSGRLPTYQYAPKLTSGKSKELPVGYFHVDRYEVDSSFKTLENLGMGTFGSKLIAYDPIRMKYDTIKYDYYKNRNNQNITRMEDGDMIINNPENLEDDSNRIFGDFIATDVNASDGKPNKFVSTDSYLLGSHDASIRLATTTRDHQTVLRDKEAKQNYVEKWLLQRMVQIQEFDNIIVKINVPGNSSRHVGDLIRFEMPTSVPDDDPLVPSVDYGHRILSGNYLISSIRHIIKIDKYEMDMELIKNSFATRLSGQKVEGTTQ